MGTKSGVRPRSGAGVGRQGGRHARAQDRPESSGRAVLWAPWRGVYLTGPKPRECIFCTARDAPNPAEHYVLAREPAIVMLNKFPYSTAHLMVAPRAHTGDFAGMSASDACTVLSLVQRAAAVLQEVYKPDGMNIGLNLGEAAGAGFADHLHWHLVPRWKDDTNFMPVIASAKVMPDHLAAVYDKLRPHFSTA